MYAKSTSTVEKGEYLTILVATDKELVCNEIVTIGLVTLMLRADSVCEAGMDNSLTV